MQRLIIILVITLLVAIFAFQNSLVVNLHLWFWKAEMHMGLVLIITFVIGALIGIFASLPQAVKKNRQIRELKNQLDQAKQIEKDPEFIIESSSDPEFEDVDQ